MSRIVEGIGGQPEQDPLRIRELHEVSPTHPIEGPFGYTSIQIRHKGELYHVGIARAVDELNQVAALDNRTFGQHRRINTERLADIRDEGYVLTLKNPQGELVAQSQILLNPSPEYPDLCPDEARLMGTSVADTERGKGYAQVMMKAQETIALEAGKTHLTMSVRPENAESIRVRQHMGYRIVGFESDANGIGCFTMEKDFHTKPLPFTPDKQADRVRNGAIAVLTSPEQLAAYEATKINELSAQEIAVSICSGDKIDRNARNLAAMLLKKGYQGTGILRPDEYGATDGKSLLIFQKTEGRLPVEKPTLPFHVTSDYSPLREVVLSYSPNVLRDNTRPGKYADNNPVAQAVEDTMNQTEFYDEHQALVKALESQGIHVILSNAFHPEVDRWGVYTRDPGIVIGDKMVTSTMMKENRAYETASLEALAGKDVIKLTGENVHVEGGDVILLGDNVVAVGIGKRTTKEGFDALVRAFEGSGLEFIGVPHQDLHLDVIFTVLGHKKVLADIELLPPEFVRELKEKGFTVVEVEHNEQPTLGANVLAIDDGKVIAVAENKVTNQRLRDAGIEVIEVSMPNIIKGGGGPRCLTCPTNRE